MLAAPLVAFGAVFSAPIIALLYGAQYAEAAPVFAVCLFACTLATVTQGGSSLLVSADRQLTILVMVVGCGLLKILLDVLLIRAYGLHGATLAYLVVAVVNAAAVMTLALRAIGLHPDWARLLRISVAAALAGLAALPLRGHWPSLPTLVVGAIVVAVCYAILTLLLRCWSSADTEHLQQLVQRYARGRPKALMRLLEWSGRATRQVP
jgi:O-antigen/teichoic acid export membrane protein